MKERKEDEMTGTSVRQQVAQHPFLRGLKPKQLAFLSDCTAAAHFDAGDTVFLQGEKAERFYLIVSGKVVLESGAEYGEPVVIETIVGGDVLGWSWMMPPYRWHFTARALEPTETILLAGSVLRPRCERDHSLGFELHKRMSEVMMNRLQAARKKMLSVHARHEKLEPAIGLSPFMEQEFDIYADENGAHPPGHRAGAD
jgi:CRP/FNR family transcriptional regulator, cyclic AMP receptor protein